MNPQDKGKWFTPYGVGFYWFKWIWCLAIPGIRRLSNKSTFFLSNNIIISHINRSIMKKTIALVFSAVIMSCGGSYDVPRDINVLKKDIGRRVTHCYIEISDIDYSRNEIDNETANDNVREGYKLSIKNAELLLDSLEKDIDVIKEISSDKDYINSLEEAYNTSKEYFKAAQNTPKSDEERERLKRLNHDMDIYSIMFLM